MNRPLRRLDRKLSIEASLALISQQTIMRMAMCDQGKPYVVSLNYGYAYENEILTFYFHSAKEGRKLDIIQQNPNVCVIIDGQHELMEGKTNCEYGFSFESVIADGICTIITGEEKRHALSLLMKQQTGMQAYHFSGMDHVTVCKIEVSSFCGKRCPKK